MAAILNSAMNLDYRHCHLGFRHLQLFILTQLDDGSHLEICHLRFRHCHLRHLVIFSEIHSETLSLHSDSDSNSVWLIWWCQPSWILPSWIQPFCTKLWLKLIQSDSNSFILTHFDDVSHLEFYHLGFSHFAQKKLHSFILTQLDDGSHLEFCHVGFRHCHLGFRHLVIFSQIHSKTLSLLPDSDLN